MTSPPTAAAANTSATLEPLVVDLVEWVAREPRTYSEVIDAWRTSCPRLTVWEDAVDRDLVRREKAKDGALLVVATQAGRTLLVSHGRAPG